MSLNRINARLSPPLTEFVERMVGDIGLYETSSEYIRDLIRRDMERRDDHYVRESIITGYRDMASGAVILSTGDFKKDMKILEKKESV